MANEFYTLIIVPHAKARFRKIQISVRLTKWVLGATTAATIVLSGVLVHYTRVAAEVHELRHLRAENKALLSKTQEYELSAGKLQAKLQQLQSMVMKLGVMAGLEHSLPEPGAGVGGVLGLDSSPPRLDPSALSDIDRSLTRLTDRSAQLENIINAVNDSRATFQSGMSRGSLRYTSTTASRASSMYHSAPRHGRPVNRCIAMQ